MAPDTNKARDSAASILAILDSKPEIDSRINKGTTLSNVGGDIELEHVSFKYPNRPDVQIFKDLSLSIPSGKTVALVGESGSGKSTVISVLERFYNPDSGRIFLDNVELHKFKLSWLRQQMGLVGQEPILFNETIRMNIAYGKQGEATEEEIIAATKAANAHNFIAALPQGYDTSVGDALDTVMVSRTTVVVAHRLSTIKNADIIAVVKNGVIAEKGKHDVLMKINNGAYASLVALHMNSS